MRNYNKYTELVENEDLRFKDLQIFKRFLTIIARFVACCGSLV